MEDCFDIIWNFNQKKKLIDNKILKCVIQIIWENFLETKDQVETWN